MLTIAKYKGAVKQNHVQSTRTGTLRNVYTYCLKRYFLCLKVYMEDEGWSEKCYILAYILYGWCSRRGLQCLPISIINGLTMTKKICW